MRIKRSVNALKKRRKTLKLAKGYRATKSTLYRVAKEQVMKSGEYAFRGRRMKKRDFRKLWIARINAAARINGLTYSRLMDGLKKLAIDINRKMLSELAVNDAKEFTNLCEKVKQSTPNS
ncbi:MAG: 50S ribosomal protein L20 [Christensenellaceae bacterium]|jgi:large subunit ribosomal protein L20|nr:50S ribosomal protein L20 [Christensenellaceae bacterium]